MNIHKNTHVNTCLSAQMIAHASCMQHINQKFTRVARPQTNGKAERVIRTLMGMWYQQHVSKEAPHRQVELVRFINFCNTVKPHKSLNKQTPYEILVAYFNQPLITN